MYFFLIEIAEVPITIPYYTRIVEEDSIGRAYLQWVAKNLEILRLIFKKNWDLRNTYFYSISFI